MKNKIFSYVVAGLIILAVIGAVSAVISDPIGLLKWLGITIVIVGVILLLVKLAYQPSPQRREQRAFIKAARRSKRDKTNRTAMKAKRKQSSVTSFKKMKLRRKSSIPNLTVIEGKKGKKKNRASF